MDQILSQKPCNLWLSATDGNDGQTPTFGPFVRLARPHVQVFVQVKVRVYILFRQVTSNDFSADACACVCQSPAEAKIAALTGAHAVVLQGKGSGGFVSAPEKPLSERKTSAAMAEATAASASASASAGDLTGTGYPGDELDVAFPPSFEDDVNAHLDWDWDIKTPGYDPRAATPPSAPTPTPPTLSPRYPLSELIPASIAAINSLGLRNPPLIVAAGGISTGTDIVQCFRLGADAVAIGTLFAVARESELSSDDKIAFAEAAALPRNNRSPQAASATATGTTRTNPDGSVVKIGDSSAFASTYGFAGNNNKEMLSTAVNLPAAEILELLVADFCFQQDVEDATAAL